MPVYVCFVIHHLIRTCLAPRGRLAAVCRNAFCFFFRFIDACARTTIYKYTRNGGKPYLTVLVNARFRQERLKECRCAPATFSASVRWQQWKVGDPFIRIQKGIQLLKNFEPINGMACWHNTALGRESVVRLG